MLKSEKKKSESIPESATGNLSFLSFLTKSVRGRILLLLLVGDGLYLGGLNVLKTDVPQAISDLLTEDEWDDETQKAVSELESRYHLKIIFSKKGKSGLENKRKTLETLALALRKYPAEMFKGLNLEIRIEAWLGGAINGDSAPRYTGRDFEGGQPEHIGNIVRLNSAPVEGKFRFDELTVHHEINHCFFHEEWLRRYAGEDENKNNLEYEWAMLYHSDGFKAKKGDGFFDRGRPEGYAMRYGYQNTAEDIATIAHMMFMEPHELVEICEKDQYLNNKVGLLRRYYSRWSNGLMDDQFWKDIADGKVDADYWERRKGTR